MILGDRCTRSCRFCGVRKGTPIPLDPKEPERIARTATKLGLQYVVITSVTRDDLPDGGAAQFAKVVRQLTYHNSHITAHTTNIKVEVLIPDFKGNETSLATALNSNPFVLNHNLETVPRLYSQIRPEAGYKRSLSVLKMTKRLKEKIYTKSGIMVGLGEKKEEVFSVLNDLKNIACDIVTIGQYLPPSKSHQKVVRYVEPSEFEEYKAAGEKFGLKVFAGPFVRSSYHAKDLIK